MDLGARVRAAVLEDDQAVVRVGTVDSTTPLVEIPISTSVSGPSVLSKRFSTAGVN